MFSYGCYQAIMAGPYQDGTQACAMDPSCDLYKYDHSAGYRESRGGHKSDPGAALGYLGVLTMATGIYPLSRGLRIRDMERRP